jgi:CheY-like chemotaxis protein
MHILIVEDHADSAAVLARLLRQAGHEVRVARDAREALAACGDGDDDGGGAPLDLLISDIGLPDMDGWELLRCLRRRCAVPAIALSAYGAPEDVERSRAVGFDVHLCKPVSAEALRAAVAEVERSRARG